MCYFELGTFLDCSHCDVKLTRRVLVAHLTPAGLFKSSIDCVVRTGRLQHEPWTRGEFANLKVLEIGMSRLSQAWRVIGIP